MSAYLSPFLEVLPGGRTSFKIEYCSYKRLFVIRHPLCEYVDLAWWIVVPVLFMDPYVLGGVFTLLKPEAAERMLLITWDIRTFGIPVSMD